MITDKHEIVRIKVILIDETIVSFSIGETVRVEAKCPYYKAVCKIYCEEPGTILNVEYNDGSVLIARCDVISVLYEMVK